MPIYEYKCNKCGVVEVMQRITEPALKKCPTCKSKVERIMSRNSFVLKGTGWYATDYANKGKSTAEPAGETASTANGSSSTDASSKSESKPDSKKTESKSPSESKSSSEKASAAKAAD